MKQCVYANTIILLRAELGNNKSFENEVEHCVFIASITRSKGGGSLLGRPTLIHKIVNHRTHRQLAQALREV